MQCMFLREQVLFFLCTVQQVVYYGLGKAESRTLCEKKFRRKKNKKIKSLIKKDLSQESFLGQTQSLLLELLQCK